MTNRESFPTLSSLPPERVMQALETQHLSPAEKILDIAKSALAVTALLELDSYVETLFAKLEDELRFYEKLLK